MFTRTTFKKRGGTTDKGKPYEDVMTAHFALKFTLQEDVQDFQISSNDEDFGDFDDLVMDISLHNNKRNKYAIQLKHSLHNTKLMSEDLMTLDGRFSLQKYCKDFAKNLVNNKHGKFMYVLYTNRPLQLSDKELHLKGKEHFTVKIHEIKQNVLDLATSKNGMQYRCEICASTAKLQDDETREEYGKYNNFFNNFLICSDQGDVSEIEAIVAKTMKAEFDSKHESFLQFVTKWSQCDDEKSFLVKETVKFKLGECLLSPYCSEHINIPDIECDQWDMFKKAMLQFDVTILQTVTNGDQKDLVDNSDSLDDDIIEKTGRSYGLSSEEPSQKLKILWHLNRAPLIVKIDKSSQALILKAVKLCSGKKFVLCGGSVTKTDLAGVSVFENLCDLERVDSNIVKNCMVSIQGKQKIGIEHILEHSGGKPLVTPSILLKMLGEYHIGQKQDELPQYYIERSLTRTMLDLKCLSKTESSDLFVITCDNKYLLQSSVRSKIVVLDDYLNDTRQTQTEEDDKMVLVTTHQDCVTNEKLANISVRNPYKACHHVRLIDGDKLELISSKGSIKNLKQFRLPHENNNNVNDKIKETEIIRSDRVVNIVCAAPGMGKSVLMKYLMLNYSAEYWVTYIDLKLHYHNFKLKDSLENVLNYIEKIGCDEYSELEENIKRSMQENKKLVLLWDALDEVPAEYVEAILEAVSKLRDCGLKQWIASRPHLEMLLEDRFDTFASHIVELSQSQQEEYVNRRLNADQAKKLRDGIRRMHSEFLGVPLLLFILTELFLKKKDDWNFFTNMARSVLYRYFIEEQFKTYYTKTECNLNNHIMQDILNEHQSNRLEQYELIGALSCFGEVVIKKKNKCRRILEKFKSDGVGIINVKNGSPVFFHRTFGEYFAACWLVKNHSKVTNFATLIFQEEFKGVRFMMDSILAEDCPAHLAVLHQDLEELEKCSREICDRKDKGGRNVLQVLSTWGRMYPPLIVEKLGDEYMVDLTPGNGIFMLELRIRKLPLRSEEVTYRKLYDFFIDSVPNNPLEKDSLFGWNTFSYADAAMCLYPFEVLVSKHNINFDNLKNYSDICTVIFYSIICNFDALFETVIIESIPRIQFKKGNKLLHLATEFGSCCSLKKILDSKFYHKQVNDFYPFVNPGWFQFQFINFNALSIQFPYKTTDERNVEIPVGLSALHFACEDGNLNKVRILIKHKAMLDISDNYYQVTPLHLAVINGHVDIVKFLIKNGANPNVENLSGFKLLHLAAFHGHLDVMKFLISKKVCKVDCKALYYDITPLHVAAANGQLEAIQYLVSKGANVNAKVSCGPTCARTCYAIRNLNRKISIQTVVDIPELKLLLEERQKRKFGATSLHFASSSGNIAAVKFLVGRGSRVLVEDILKELPVTYAVGAGYKDIVKFFALECRETLQLGGINEQNFSGHTCLHFAIQMRNCEMVEYLINLGAVIEKSDLFGYTPLLFSAATNCVRSFEVLMNNGANVQACLQSKLNNPLNVFQIAALNNSIDVLRFLRANGFNMNVTIISNENYVFLVPHIYVKLINSD